MFSDAYRKLMLEGASNARGKRGVRERERFGPGIFITRHFQFNPLPSSLLIACSTKDGRVSSGGKAKQVANEPSDESLRGIC